MGNNIIDRRAFPGAFFRGKQVNQLKDIFPDGNIEFNAFFGKKRFNLIHPPDIVRIVNGNDDIPVFRADRHPGIVSHKLDLQTLQKLTGYRHRRVILHKGHIKIAAQSNPDFLFRNFEIGDQEILNRLPFLTGFGYRIVELLLGEDVVFQEIVELALALGGHPLLLIKGDAHDFRQFADIVFIPAGKRSAGPAIDQLDHTQQIRLKQNRRCQHLLGPKARALIPAAIELQ